MRRPGARASCAAALSLVAAGVAAPPALAQTGGVGDVLAAPLQAEITPDLWGLNMSAKGSGGGQAVGAHITLGDILQHLDGLALGELDVRKGPAFVLADATYAHVTLPGQGPLAGARLPIGATFATFGAGWTFGPMPLTEFRGAPVTLSVSPFAGANYADLAFKVDTPQGPKADVGLNWWSPLVGARVDLVRGRSSVRLEGYASGFTNGEEGRQALVAYAYRVPWRRFNDPQVGVGYRYSSQDREVAPGQNLGLRLQGPVVFVTFHL